MPVRLTPRGTRGGGFTKLPAWVVAIFKFLNLSMFRLAGRRMRIQGRPLLTTTGAKSGRLRQTTLAWFPDEDGPGGTWLVVASNAGAAAHPSWYVNLARHPESASIEVDGRRVDVRADSLHGAERERAWSRIVALAPGYGAYTEQTDREIPVVRLTPRR